jgi:hypothetical protein
MNILIKNIANKKKDAVKIEEQHASVERKYKAKWTMIQANGNEYSINKDEQTFELIKSHRVIEAHDSHSREVNLKYMKLFFRNFIFQKNIY